MSKKHLTVSIDEDLDVRIKQKRLEDSSFQISPIINSALWSYFEKEDVDVEKKNEIIQQMNDFKDRRKEIDNKMTSLSLQLYEIEKKEKENEKEHEKMKDIKLNTLLANRPDFDD